LALLRLFNCLHRKQAKRRNDMSGSLANDEVSSSLTNNVEGYGRLVKSWATGKDYVNVDFADQPPGKGFTAGLRPAWALGEPQKLPVEGSGATAAASEMEPPRMWVLSKEEFKNRAAAAKVEISGDFERVVIVQGVEGTLVLRLPAEEYVRRSEDELLNAAPPAPYGLPPFYDEQYAQFYASKPPSSGGAGRLPVPKLIADKMRLHANRIGDYSMSNCR
jgi:hypothetical protein